MPWMRVNGEVIEVAPKELIERLRALADDCDRRFSVMSNQTAFYGEHFRQAADEIEKLTK